MSDPLDLGEPPEDVVVERYVNHLAHAEQDAAPVIASPIEVARAYYIDDGREVDLGDDLGDLNEPRPLG